MLELPTAFESDGVLIERIDATLREVVEERGLPEPLREAVLYAALGPGKRVRPLLVLRCFDAVGGGVGRGLSNIFRGRGRVFRGAAAVELVHAFSLVHDDLPAMDDDDLRRGRATLHKKFDEATAILAGDVMQSLAWEVLAGVDAGVGNRAPSPGPSQGEGSRQRVSAELSGATTGMIAGQVLDTMGGAVENGGCDEDRLRAVHRLKTGALLRAACRIGALLGGAGSAELEALTRYAEALGLMFQAVDDLLDVTSDSVTLGKAAGKDAQAGKLTYPGVLGIEGTQEQVRRLHGQTRAALEAFGPAADPLREMADRLATRQR